MITHSSAMSFDAGGGGSGESDGFALRPSGPGGAWRVITVGRTGLEQSLRRESGIELIRARSTFEAVGELSDALESDAMVPPASGSPHAAPCRCLVLVADDAVSGEIAGSFVAAMKSMQPLVAVLLVCAREADAPASTRSVFDAVVSPAATPDDVRRVAASVLAVTSPELVQVKAAASPASREDAARPGIGGTDFTVQRGQADDSGRIAWSPTPRPPQPPQQQQQQQHAVASQAPRESTSRDNIARDQAARHASAGDTVLLAALLAGRDVLLPALDMLRERMGDGSITYVPATSSAEAGAATPSARPAIDDALEPVVHSGTLFGHLRFGSTHLGRAERSVAAAWLSMYLALQAQQNALRTAAMVDDLTGAYNRRYFEHFMASALAQAQRERHTLTLLVFDLDGFKSFNDRFGHAAGDLILRETVSLLRSVIRPADKVCRIGGDEFAVIFYEPTGPRDIGSKPPEDVTIIAKRFQQQVRAHRFPKLGGAAPGSLTISGGLATFPWDGRTATELLAHADNLALAAKRDGKNAIRIGPDGSSRSTSFGHPST